MLSKFKKKNDIPKGYPRGLGIEWTSKASFRLHGYDFDIPTSMKDFVLSDERTHKDRLYLAKTPSLISRYVNLFTDRRPGKILELGVYRGGSAAFMQLMAKPARLLALELSPDRLQVLDNFVEKEGLADSFHVAYGVDQANTGLVMQLAAEHLGTGRCIDLVIDDASHLLAPTRSTFQTVFPFLRTGGSYIVEDFASSHISSSSYLKPALAGNKSAQTFLRAALRDGLQADLQPLHILAVEAMLGAISAPGLIQRVIVDQHWLRIVRGHQDFEEASSFDLQALADDQFSLLKCTPSKVLAEFVD